MCTQKISYFSRRPTNHTPEMDSESVGRFALVTQKEGTLSSILDGTTRTGTDLRQYNLRFQELHPICLGYCSRERQSAIQ